MNLYLPIEIINREFHSKLLIAMEGASRGMKVYMGRLKEYLLRDFFAPGIVLQKSITPSPSRLNELKFYKKKNFILTSLDEEVGLVNFNNKYVKERFSNKSLELTHKVFTWGKFDYNNLVNKYTKHKKKFVKSGNPRIDFWRKDLEFFFKKKKFKYKNYILFSFNFALKSQKEFDEHLKFMKSSGYRKRGFTLRRSKNIRRDSFRIFEKFSQLIKVLSNKTKLKIIVRPHPIDKINNYILLEKLKNVKVLKKGNISDWIHNAEIVIHSGCAGGLEASVRGKPTISYVPFKSTHGHQFSNKFSIKAKSLKQCLDIVEKITMKNFKSKKNNLKDFHSRAYNITSYRPGYKTIVDEFEKLSNIQKYSHENNDYLLNFKFKIRDIRSKFLKLNYGNIKFSFFDKKETLKSFEILKELNPKFNKLKLNFIKKDIIQIKKIG